MSYNELRHLADSYGLVFMAATFLTLVAWPFRRGARAHHRRAAESIFEHEDRTDG